MKLATLSPILDKYHQAGDKITLVTGVFDVLHQHHYQFLVESRKSGDRLIIGIEADTRVKMLKGSGRPIYPQEVRRENLLNLGVADQVFILPDDFSTPEAHIKLIQSIKPNVLAVSANTNHLEVKRQILEMVGGQVKIVYDHFPQTSTTDVLTNSQIYHFQNKTMLRISKPHTFSAQVISGMGKGKILGFPTLNLQVPREIDYPLGIFYGKVKLGDQWDLGAFHWGPIPTYDRAGLSLEVFVIGQAIETPPEKVEFRLLVKIRDIINFDNSNQLIKQIKTDVDLIKILDTLT